MNLLPYAARPDLVPWAATRRTTTRAQTITAKENSVVRVPRAYSTGVVTLVVMPRVIRYKIHAVENRADSNAAQGMVPGETVPQTSRCPTLMQPWRGCPR